MNTMICDAETSDLADLLGPIMVIWLGRFGSDWVSAEYGDRVVHIPEQLSDWCLSELVPFWAADEEPIYDTPYYHEECRWQ